MNRARFEPWQRGPALAGNTERKLRNANNPGEIANSCLGLTLNQFHGNVLQAMGVPRSRYQESTHDGYGCRPRDGIDLGDINNHLNVGSAHPQRIWAVAGQTLPWLAP